MVQTLSIRTKLLMAVLSLFASVALMAVTADAANAAVTEIRTVYNYTDKDVYIWNHESGARHTIAPGGTLAFNQWVPWARDKTDFNRGKYIEVGYWETGEDPDVRCGLVRYCPRFSFWQENRPPEGDKIRYTGQFPQLGPVHYRQDAKPMPGASHTGGRRNLIIRNLGVVGEAIRVDVELRQA